MADLESGGVIVRYAATVDPPSVGLHIVAFITMTCDGERCRRLATELVGITEVIACHRLTGDASALLKAVVPSVEALEVLVDRLALLGKPSTALVLSTSFSGRPLRITAA